MVRLPDRGVPDAFEKDRLGVGGLCRRSARTRAVAMAVAATEGRWARRVSATAAAMQEFELASVRRKGVGHDTSANRSAIALPDRRRPRDRAADLSKRR